MSNSTPPSATALISAERRRQRREEEFDDYYEDKIAYGELARAAACYALPVNERPWTGEPPLFWPWAASYWLPTPYDRIRELVKAGALIVAEIERLQRLEK